MFLSWTDDSDHREGHPWAVFVLLLPAAVFGV